MRVLGKRRAPILAALLGAVAAAAAFLLVQGESAPPSGPSGSEATAAPQEKEPGVALPALEAESEVERNEAQASRREPDFGGVTGLLVDEQGAPVAGATVTLSIWQSSLKSHGLAGCARRSACCGPSTCAHRAWRTRRSGFRPAARSCSTYRTISSRASRSRASCCAPAGRSVPWRRPAPAVETTWSSACRTGGTRSCSVSLPAARSPSLSEQGNPGKTAVQKVNRTDK